MDEQNKPGRCGWIALGLVLFFVQGLLPAGFIGGAAGLQAAEMLEHGGSELISRVFALTGMIMGLMVFALITMLLVDVLIRIVRAVHARAARFRSSTSCESLIKTLRVIVHRFLLFDFSSFTS